MLDYKKNRWYINTYNSLGSSWLIAALDKINLKDEYVLVNLSANSGYYERDAYNDALKKGKKPKYYLSDLKAEELCDEKASVKSAKENFTYFPKNTDAYTFNVNLIKEKADVILDIKGALWHSFRDRKMGNLENVKALLKNYIDILDCNGVLLIDYYLDSYFCGLFEKIIRIAKYRKCKIYNFQEYSTFVALRKAIDEKWTSEGKILNISKEDATHPLAKHMGVIVYSRNSLIEMLEYIEKISVEDEEKRYKKIFKEDLSIGILVYLAVMCILMFIGCILGGLIEMLTGGGICIGMVIGITISLIEGVLLA